MGVIKRLVCFILLACVWPGICRADPLQNKKIMVVHSYHETQAGHVVEMTSGIREAFEGCAVTMRFFHMDTKRRPDPAWKKEAGRQAGQAMDAFGPDVVIAMDDNAQLYFVVPNMDRVPDTVFIFGGVNAEISIYGYPRPNVTGVLERPNIRESIDLLLKIRPKIKKVLMISDKSRTTDLFAAYAKTLDLPVAVAGYAQPLTLGEWRNTIARYKDEVDAFGVYLLRTVRREKGRPEMVPEQELVAELNRISGLPTVGFYDTAARSGLLCGISVSMKEQGYAAGRMARAVLEGKVLASLPIEPTRRGRIQLNLRTAEALGIELDYRIISKADVLIK